MFNKQIELGRIVDKGMALIYSPQRAKTQEGALIALDQINAELSKFKEDLPFDMRLKQWSTLTETVPIHVAVLQ